jgi:hypothetical protein
MCRVLEHQRCNACVPIEIPADEIWYFYQLRAAWVQQRQPKAGRQREKVSFL